MSKIKNNNEINKFEFKKYYLESSKPEKGFARNRKNLLDYVKERVNAIDETKEVLFNFSDFLYHTNSDYVYNKTYLKEHVYNDEKFDTYIEFLKTILVKEKIYTNFLENIRKAFKTIKNIDSKEFYKLNFIFDDFWGLRLKGKTKNVHYNRNDLQIDYVILSSRNIKIIVEYQYEPKELKSRILNYNINIEKEIKKLTSNNSIALVDEFNIKNNKNLAEKIEKIVNEIKEDIVNFYELTRRYEK